MQPSKRRHALISLILRLILAVIVLTYALGPVLWTVSAAFNPTNGLSGQKLIPASPTLKHFATILSERPFGQWMLNSLKVSGISALCSVFITMLAAYSFSRFRFAGRNQLLLMVLLVQVFPALLTMAALYALMRQIGEYVPWLGFNSHGGLILLYMGGAMGINVWLMKGFFDSIPREIDESAMIDGASHWRIFWSIIFPLARPIIAVVALLAFVGTYSDWVLARIMIQDSQQFTLMLGLQQFIQDNYGQNWGPYTAGAILGALPIIVIYIVLQDYIVGGLTRGAVKG
ncbi:MAG: sugar ABC transporter permease [Anaerolineae bacterium]|nr:sugar ABC transporter permease [Anaerolineae bacterium]